ncbi:MAG TPA: lactate racemase domain-containing protein [Anaeromyxobacteraceae bacterium]|nr:lactate racemase domain-containing protein [Anaeromyxobacteraceae bacterium]
MARQHQIVFGSEWLTVRLPDDAWLVPQAISLPLPAADPGEAVRAALAHPLDSPPLGELARGARRVTIAFDDPTVPCWAPIWEAAVGAALAELDRAGVPRGAVTLLCANALHRKFTAQELSAILGHDLVAAFAPEGRLLCHDAEDGEGLLRLGATAEGEEVELSRLAVESDLVVYVNASTIRGFSGGWKSICVGLSSYRSIRHHHTPDTMSMSVEKNRMHLVLDRMGAVVERALGPRRFFKLETVLSNPAQVHRVLAGSIPATRRAALEIARAHQPPRRDLVSERADVVLYGVPDWSPYAAFSRMNPILTLVSTGLGYLGGMVEAVGKPGCTVVMATPCPDEWDHQRHPSYREVWERVLPSTRDPFEARARFEPELAGRPDYLEKYRRAFAFHPVHAVMALYPLKRLRHAGRVVVAGARDPAVPRHLGFEAAATVEEAMALAASFHGGRPSVALVQNPMAASRQ